MFATPAYAQAAGAAAQGGSPAAMIGSILPLVLIFVIFYFLMIRPQQKRMKTHQAMLGALKKGDHVVTGGGLVGKITRVEDEQVEIELAPNVRVRAVRATLTGVTPAGTGKPAND